jgi:VWFA-related protein
MRRLFSAAVAVSLVTAIAYAQAPVFQADSHLALLQFQLKPKKGVLISDLRPDEIQILEDGVPQRVALFEGGRLHPQRTPVEITFLFDCGTHPQQLEIRKLGLFRQHLLDEFDTVSIAIYAFSGYARLRLAEPTRDESVLARAMETVWDFPTGDGPLFSAIRDTARQIAPKGEAGVRRLLVVVSSGILGDVDHAAESAAVARDHGVVVYPVRLQLSPICLRTPESRLSVQMFDSLGPQTGGRSFRGRLSLDDTFPELLRWVATEIRSTYVAGYYPSTAGGTKQHKAQVVLASKDRGQVIGGTRVVLR